MPLSRHHQQLRAKMASAVLDRCIAAEATQREIAALCDVDPAVVSRWRTGEDVLELWHVASLVEAFGPDVVFGVSGRLGRPDLLVTVATLSAEASALTSSVVVDLGDGRVDDAATHGAALDRMLVSIGAARAALERR